MVGCITDVGHTYYDISWQVTNNEPSVRVSLISEANDTIPDKYTQSASALETKTFTQRVYGNGTVYATAKAIGYNISEVASVSYNVAVCSII